MNPIGTDTAGSCWLCDRDRGELCHVHEPREAKDEPDLAWVQPTSEPDDQAIDQA